MTVGGDFVKAWTLLLEFMENAASNKNVEVCRETFFKYLNFHLVGNEVLKYIVLHYIIIEYTSNTQFFSILIIEHKFFIIYYLASMM